jgi:hypothetical protein
MIVDDDHRRGDARSATPPTFWTRPDGGQEPFCAPTKEEIAELLGKIDRPLGEKTRLRLKKVLTWLLLSEFERGRRQGTLKFYYARLGDQKIDLPEVPKGLTERDLIRALLFRQALDAVGWPWPKAGRLAAEWSKGMPCEGSARTMYAAHEKAQSLLPVDHRRPVTYRQRRRHHRL